MDFRIRRVRIGDYKEVYRILKPIIESGFYTVHDNSITEEKEREFISSFPDSGIFYVAEINEGSKLLGFQILERFAQYTHAFDHVGVIATYVDLNERGRRVGTILSEGLLKKL